MKIGLQQTGLGVCGTTDGLAHARRAGADGVGLCVATEQDLHAVWSPGFPAAIRAQAARQGQAIAAIRMGMLCKDSSLLGPSARSDWAKESIRHTLSVASQLGGTDVVLPFFGPNRAELQSQWNAAAELLSELADSAETYGVALVVECPASLDRLQALLGACDSDLVKVCLDVGETVTCRQDPASIIRGLGASAIAQVHLKDVPAVSGVPPDFSIHLGYGDVNCRAVASALGAIGWDGWVLVEAPAGDDDGVIASRNVKYARDVLATPAPDPGASPREHTSQEDRYYARATHRCPVCREAIRGSPQWYFQNILCADCDTLLQWESNGRCGGRWVVSDVLT